MKFSPLSKFFFLCGSLVMIIGAIPILRGAEEKSTPQATLKVKIDAKPINRDASDRVSYAPIVKRTAASVVYLHSNKKGRPPELEQLLNDPVLRRYFELQENGKGGRRGGDGGRSGTAPRTERRPEDAPQGLGSGVVVTADGYILTNNHLVDGVDDLKVSIGESAKRYDARIVGRDTYADVAVLKIEATGLSAVTFGDSDQLQVGDVVLAIGNPFGAGQSVSRGIVSALSRGMGSGVIEDFIQTDAAINPGNSGGALLDSDGRVVGLNTAILSRAAGFAGVGVAIPSNLARNVAEQIVHKGRVERGSLGVSVQDLDEALSAQFGAETGVLVSEVNEDGPAEKAGLKPGDIITRINGKEARDSRQLLLTVSQIAPETKIPVTYLRDGKIQTATATLVRRPEDATSRVDNPSVKDEGVLNGVGVTDITPQLREQLDIPPRIKGVLITGVEAGSPSARQGLREGDVILSLDNRPISDASGAVKLSEEIKGPKVTVRVWRENRMRFLVIDETK